MLRNVLCFAALLGLLMACGCQAPAPPDHSAELKPVMDAYVEAWNTGQVDGLDSVAADNVQRHAPSGFNSSANSLEDLKAAITRLRTAFPDARVAIDEAHFMENRSIAKWTFTGTNSGEGDFPATGKSVSVSGVSIARYEGGKMVEDWVYADSLDMMTQLGFSLAPPAEEEESEGQQ